MLNKLLSKIKENKKGLIILTVLLLISGIAHGYNMFHFPYYENDEGTYMAQAWSVLTQGKLAPYTYWYDHAPMGWFLIALWTKLTGGFFTFGFSINSGRVLMLVIHLGSSLLLYGVSKRITKSVFASVLAVIIFSLSPLGIYFQRRVLLDNIMTFWILASFLLLLGSGRKLHHFFISAFFFSIAVLTKETAIFFLPAFLYLVYSQAHKTHKSFAFINWLAIISLVISFYPLFALLKGELFPSGSWLGGNQPHVSLLETIKYQASRPREIAFQSLFYIWFIKDYLILTVGAISSIFNIFLSFKNKSIRYISLFTLSFWFFLFRGSVIYEFYVIPVIPLLALNIAISAHFLLSLIRKTPILRLMYYPLMLAVFLLFILSYKTKTEVYMVDQTSNQLQAVRWIKENVPSDSIILIDNFAFLDLRYEIPGSIHIDRDAEWYWKADKDPEIKIKLLKNDWRNINYLLASGQMKADAYESDLELVKHAFENSTTIATFIGQDAETRNDIEIRQVNNDKDILSKAWGMYKQTFTKSAGAIYDPYTSRITSEGQAYSFLRAVWAGDKQEFDRVWKWTDENMRLRDNNLFAWLHAQEEEDEEGISDEGTATDADQDIALALLFAYKKWDNLDYLNQAKKIIDDIWELETAESKGKRYVVAGNWASAKENKIYTINPSYIAPYAYRVFAEVDTQHDWNGLLDTSYEILKKCSETSFDLGGSVNIPPDWCAFDKNGKVVQADNISDKSTNYSYDAIRTLWRIALDYRWNKEPRALSFLQKMDIWSREWKEKQKIFTSYSHNGRTTEETESLAHYGTQVAFFSVVNPDIAEQIYKQKILSQWNKEGFWGDSNNYYDQNWVWFGTALYTNNLPNLWSSRD